MQKKLLFLTVTAFLRGGNFNLMLFLVEKVVNVVSVKKARIL